MEITAITKFKHGTVYRAMKELGWSQARLARETGLNQTTIGRVLNLVDRPSERTITAIQLAFGRAGVYIDPEECWPDAFMGSSERLVIQQTADVDPAQLEASRTQLRGRHLQIGYESFVHSLSETEAISVFKTIPRLTKKEITVITMYFINNKTAQEIADILRVSTSRIHQLKKNGIEKIRSYVSSTTNVGSDDPMSSIHYGSLLLCPENCGTCSITNWWWCRHKLPNNKLQLRRANSRQPIE